MFMKLLFQLCVCVYTSFYELFLIVVLGQKFKAPVFLASLAVSLNSSVGTRVPELFSHVATDLSPKLLGIEFQPNLCIHPVAPVSPLGLPDSPPPSFPWLIHLCASLFPLCFF